MKSTSRLHFVQRRDAAPMRCGDKMAMRWSCYGDVKAIVAMRCGDVMAMRRPCDGHATAMRRRCNRADSDDDETAQKQAQKNLNNSVKYLHIPTVGICRYVPVNICTYLLPAANILLRQCQIPAHSDHIPADSAM